MTIVLGEIIKSKKSHRKQGINQLINSKPESKKAISKKEKCQVAFSQQVAVDFIELVKTPPYTRQQQYRSSYFRGKIHISLQALSKRLQNKKQAGGAFA